ncbi:OLC1v1027523C1 [Oldenlandia corymbosa var. corymbosa]|uniref:OLC1v1027523C1 n=1 Tax=Oldenlandia corymbosa var. corymbosa TaxID=529605 RepID=A0AAV1CCQ4_OLDCO|nr:OLC1v1027523C1 [Oldenlandia corymbosa var. corymbosa]
MAENRAQDQQVHPLPKSYNYNDAYAVHDQESGTAQSKEFRKKKRVKCLAYILAFAVFQTGIILIFALTVMKIRTPKFRVRNATFENFDVGTPANPSFNLRMNAEIGVKNANFGTFKFESAPIVFLYDGSPVGQGIVPATQAGWRTTKKLNVVVDLSSGILANKTQLGNDISSGILELNALSSLTGKVRLTFVFKKKKTTNMNCTVAIGLTDRTIREINCQ